MSSSGWQKVRFGDLLVGGTRNGLYKKKEFHGSGAKVVNMGELFAHSRLFDIPMKRVEATEKELEKSGLAQGDLLFARRSLTAEGAGKCSIVMTVNEPTVFESSIIRARLDQQKSDSLFYYYFFSSPQGKAALESIRRQVAVAGITGGDLVELEVPAPSLEIQHGVSQTLGFLDEKIELNRQTARTLEELAQRMFKSWFVDFDPVRAKMSGRQPAHMPSGTAALFPDKLVDSTLGLIPEGWQSSSFYDSVDVISGGTPKTKVDEYWGGDIPWYSVVDHPPGGMVFVTRTEKAITESGLKNSPAKLVPAFTTVLSARGTVGKVAITGKAMTFNQSCYGFRGRSSDHFRVYFQTMNMVDYLQSVAHGSVFSTITRDTLKSVQVVQPTTEVQQEFEELVDPLMQKILLLNFENENLLELRDRLIPKLISGEIRVVEAPN